MEVLAFALIGAIWAVWLVGIISLYRMRRPGLAFAAAFLPGIGLLIALYALVAVRSRKDPATVVPSHPLSNGPIR